MRSGSRHEFNDACPPTGAANGRRRTLVKIIGKDGNSILSVDGWYAGAPPKGGAAHWVTGRSARELAVAWCGSEGPCVPAEIEQLLRSHPDLETPVIERALPEHQIRFDDLPGEPRNADLAIEARDGIGLVAITIEGKAERASIALSLRSSSRRLNGSQQTRRPARCVAWSPSPKPCFLRGGAICRTWATSDTNSSPGSLERLLGRASCERRGQCSRSRSSSRIRPATTSTRRTRLI